MANVVRNANLGPEFDIGSIQPNKIRVKLDSDYFALEPDGTITFAGGLPGGLPGGLSEAIWINLFTNLVPLTIPGGIYGQINGADLTHHGWAITCGGGDVSINSIFPTAPTENRLVVVMNADGNGQNRNIRLRHNSPSVPANRRILSPQVVTTKIRPFDFACMLYNVTDARWYCVSHARH